MIEDQFENAINELESLASGFNGLTNGLIETALEPIAILLETDDKGKCLYENSEEKDLLEIISTLENDIIPLCEEAKYPEGEKRALEMLDVFKNHLEK